MTAAPAAYRVVLAPADLSLDSREEFRRRATSEIDAMEIGSGRLVIEMRDTKSIDSAGLGALILVQRRAARRRLPVVLRGASDDLRFLLMLTKLEPLFELDPPST